MVLNYIWIAFFIVAFVIALIRLFFFGDTQIFTEIINSTFSSSKTAFEVSLGLTGVLSLWLGIMKIGENSGLIAALSRWLSPVFCRLFPEIPKGHPVMGSLFMNIAANMLGLDNAATPYGLKGDEATSRSEPEERYCLQFDDYVSGAQHIGTDADSYQYHGISCSAGSRTAYRYLYPYST
jgi:spore maturation protein SpmA